MERRQGRLTEKEERSKIIKLIEEANGNGARVHKACDIAGIAPKTYYNWKKNKDNEDKRKLVERTPANKLSKEEENEILETCCRKEYKDMPPSQIVCKLMDREQKYIASERTFYRVLKRNKMNKYRGKSRQPSRNKPKELKATGSNQVWSWDITYLCSSIKGRFYYLYMVMDVFSRMIVGWEVHETQSEQKSSELFKRICSEMNIKPDTLVLHSDNGGPMKGALIVATLEKLGVLRSLSRPHVSDDNPYSESLFKTLKYRPEYPSKPFKSIEATQLWVESFVYWYNQVHLHSKISKVSPAARHYGQDIFILERRKKILEKQKEKNPERWPGNIRNFNRIGSVTLNPTNYKKLDEKVIA